MQVGAGLGTEQTSASTVSADQALFVSAANTLRSEKSKLDAMLRRVGGKRDKNAYVTYGQE